MSLSVCVASDVDGAKTNVEFVFQKYGPSVAQILCRAQDVFTKLYASRGLNRSFVVSGSLIFNDLTSRWVPLERSSQLVHNSQVYLFQPDIVDSPGEIPPPIPADDFLMSYGDSPGQSRSPSAGGYGGRTPSPRATALDNPDPRPTFAYDSPAVTYGGLGGNAGGNAYPYHYTTGASSYQYNAAAGGTNASYTHQSHHNNTSYHSGRGRSMDSTYTDEEREESVRQMERHRFDIIPGQSIQEEERRKERARDSMSLDEYREAVRREAAEYLSQSPPR